MSRTHRGGTLRAWGRWWRKTLEDTQTADGGTGADIISTAAVTHPVTVTTLTRCLVWLSLCEALLRTLPSNPGLSMSQPDTPNDCYERELYLRNPSSPSSLSERLTRPPSLLVRRFLFRNEIHTGEMKHRPHHRSRDLTSLLRFLK